MMRTILSIMLLLAISGSARAQEEISKYFDENWNEVSSRVEASYYRIAHKTEERFWKVNDYYISGALQMTGTYKSKREKNKQGKFIYFYENGKKSSEGNYQKNKKIGEWQYYFEDGNIDSRVTYTEGNKVAEIKFHRNGHKKYSGEYWQSGIKKGVWKYWNDLGRLYMEGAFRMGLKDGKWHRYFPDGTGIKVRFNEGVPKEIMGGMIRRSQLQK